MNFKKILSLFLIFFSATSYSQKIYINVENISLTEPIDSIVVNKSVSLLNLVFNLSEFKDSLYNQHFVCSNKPSFCNSENQINGKDVFNDFIKHDTLSININVSQLRNPWIRYISKTKGITNTSGQSIKTYTWWLKKIENKELIISYASHVGHEIFHTKYFKYIHNPRYNSRNFVNDRDVTYKIDDIIEALIRKNYYVLNQ